MKILLKRASVVGMLFLAFVAVFGLVAPVSATGTVGTNGFAGDNYIFDGFWNLPKKPAPGATWWVINHGVDENGWPNTWYDRDCGDGTCVTIEREGWTKYVSLTQKTTQVPDNYYNAELAELQTGFAYGTDTPWTPEPGRPVILTARVRFSENYNPDGSGTNVGSAGVWLWNSPLDFENFQFFPQDGIGFNWVTDESIYGQGFNFNVVDDNFPVDSKPINVDMSQWHTYSIIWNENHDGTQSVKYFLDGRYQGKTDLYTPMSDLSVEIWNDNQRVASFEGEIVYDTPVEEQSMEIDYLSLFRL